MQQQSRVTFSPPSHDTYLCQHRGNKGEQSGEEGGTVKGKKGEQSRGNKREQSRGGQSRGEQSRGASQGETAP